jgi:tetratricopeptide (TPR) repeat protein
MRRLAITFAVLVLSAAALAPADELADPAGALADARSLASQHRFQQAYDILRPHLATTIDSELDWEIAAELGRAAFHIAHYSEALAILRRVVAARPVVLEPALYLGAASYLLGDRAQALAVLEAVLQAGTIDLYRAVTLPGERQFLADPEVRALLDRYSQPLHVDLQAGTCMGIALGEPRDDVVRRLGAEEITDGAVAARAGPQLIWVWSFDDDGTLAEVLLDTENLWRYTPYRPRVGDAVAWNATPAEALSALGPPQRNVTGDDDTLVLEWRHDAVALDLVFHQAEGDDDEPARLEIIRLFRAPVEDPKAG